MEIGGNRFSLIGGGGFLLRGRDDVSGMIGGHSATPSIHPGITWPQEPKTTEIYTQVSEKVY